MISYVLLLQFVDNDDPVFHRTFPVPEEQPMNSVDDDNVMITLEVQPNGNAVGRVRFKRLFMDLTMNYIRRSNTHYMNFHICVPDDVCRRSTGHLGSCVENQGSVKPGEHERKKKSDIAN